MDIRKLESSLKMQNFYFSHCSVERAENIEDREPEMSIERHISEIEEHTYDVSLHVNIDSEDLSVNVIANAKFLFEADSYEREKTIIEKNTIAIMFPFVRSQVSLLTTQPNMVPIVLPPINTAKFE